jgi:uncharacterized protein (TIGR03382 family)
VILASGLLMGPVTMLRFAAPAILATSALLAPRAAEADNCAAARVMVVLDKSSSMQTGSIGDQTKWNIAVEGLAQLLGAYDTKAEFGLMTFPNPSQCSPGSVDVAPALGNRQAIMSVLGTPPPTGGNYTPMAQTLQAAAQEASLQAAPGPRHVVLITDGWQYCVPYDPATRFAGTPAVEALTAAGVTTWVVGFGGEVDAAALNQMAVAANTAKPGCNPAQTDVTANDHCYFQVDNAAELIAALTQIAGSVSAEVCDGIDNNCDGRIDEDLVRPCSNECGTGTETCSAGQWVGCSAVCDPDEPPMNPIDDGDGGGMQAGCGCASSGGLDAGMVAPFALLGFVLFGRRRRK